MSAGSVTVPKPNWQKHSVTPKNHTFTINAESNTSTSDASKAVFRPKAMNTMSATWLHKSQWHRMWSCLHHSKLKILNYLDDTARRCASTANQCWDSPDVNDIPTAWMLEIYWTDIESDMAVKTAVAVWILWSSYNTTLYTTGLSYERRHGVVKFSNVSRTSTADAVQRWWLYQPWSVIENDKPPFLLTLLTNTNCGWHGAVWHSLTGSGWFC